MLVVGGGVVGAGCALDAATRGLSVGLVEARDFASGTSSRSSKLIHGGLRYLEMLDFGLVREALRERGLLLTRLAPHLVRPVPFLYPLQHRGWERLYAGTGVALYDTMATAAAALPRHRHLTRRGALRDCPALRKDALVGALQYYDAQVDDARHTMFLARTAAAYGAHVASRTEVVGFLREGERVTGVRVHDLEHDRTFEVRAQQVINATGVWTDDTQALVGERGQFHVRASKGIHLVVPRDRIQSDDRADPAHREERAVRHPVGPALDHRHHRHRLGRWTRRTRRRPAPTSTTCSTTSTRCWPRPLTRERRRGRLRRAAPAAVRRVRVHLEAVPRAHGRQPGARAWSWSPAASTRRTG